MGPPSLGLNGGVKSVAFFAAKMSSQLANPRSATTLSPSSVISGRSEPASSSLSLIHPSMGLEHPANKPPGNIQYNTLT